MTQTMRFGRRLNLPSTRQIRHELIMLGVREAEKLAAKETPTIRDAPEVSPPLLDAQP
jgi:hypothetical protein